MRRPSLLTKLLYALAAVFFGIVMFLGWLACAIFALDKRSPELVFLTVGIGPVVVYLVLSMAQGFSAATEPGEVDSLARLARAVNWKLCDPMLSTFGLWQAEIESHPTEIEGFENRGMVKEYVRRLVWNWSIRSALPCSVVRVSRVKPNRRSPAGKLFDEKLYRVSLVDQWDEMRRGWIHFGEGFVEFQVEAVRPQEIPAMEPAVVEECKQLVNAGLSLAPPELEHSPLWDRWLDG